MTEAKRNDAAPLGDWRWTLAFGLVSGVAGAVGLALGVWTTIASVLVFGGMLLGVAVLHLVAVVRRSDRRKGARLENLMLAAMYAALGAFFVLDPLAASHGLTLMLAGAFTAIGLMRLHQAWRRRERRSEALVQALGGAAALGLTAIVIAYWPISALWAIGVLVSAELLINGWMLVAAAVAMRAAAKRDANEK